MLYNGLIGIFFVLIPAFCLFAVAARLMSLMRGMFPKPPLCGVDPHNPPDYWPPAVRKAMKRHY